MTSKRGFGLIAALLLATAAVGGLWAQVAVPGDGITSPQFTATATRIRSNADDFIRADSWNTLNFEKWFGVGSFASTTGAGLGFATRIGAVYLGTLYAGTFWSGMGNRSYTEENYTFYGNNKTFSTYTSFPTIPDTGATNNALAVLIGVADMGFRLSLHSTYRSFKEKDVTDGGGTFYKDYKTAGGAVRPQLLWSMAKDLTDNGLRPYAAFELGFYSNYTKSEAYTSASGTGGMNVTNSLNYVNPIITIGSGGYAIYTKEGFRLTVDLVYALNIRAYNNEYSYMDSGWKVSTIKGRNTSGVLDEYSDVQNTLTPSIAGSFNMDKLALRIRLTLPLGLQSEESTAMRARTNGSLEKHGDDSKTTTFTWTPALQLAAQWRAFSKLALNIGASVSPGTLSAATEDGSSYAAGTSVSNSSYTTKTYNRVPTSNQLLFGVTFNITNNLTFEASSGVSSTGSNDVNVFDTGTNGLLHFANILVSFSF